MLIKEKSFRWWKAKEFSRNMNFISLNTFQQFKAAWNPWSRSAGVMQKFKLLPWYNDELRRLV